MLRRAIEVTLKSQERGFHTAVRTDPGGQAGAQQYIRHNHLGSTGSVDCRRLEGGL